LRRLLAATAAATRSGLPVDIRADFATSWFCRAALPRMKPGSAIVNTTSIQAFDPSPNLLACAPTKAAIAKVKKFGKSAFSERVQGDPRGPGTPPHQGSDNPLGMYHGVGDIFD